MSDHKYRFVVSIGLAGADRDAEYDLVDDLGYTEEELADPDTLEQSLEETLQGELNNYNDSYWEKI